jgi:hypothetical protein
MLGRVAPELEQMVEDRIGFTDKTRLASWVRLPVALILEWQGCPVPEILVQDGECRLITYIVNYSETANTFSWISA